MGDKENFCKLVLKEQKDFELLSNESVITWLFKNPWSEGKINIRYDEEKKWGKNITKCSSNQWSTKLSEGCMAEFILLTGEKPEKIQHKDANNHKIIPDFETKRKIIEVKCRLWNMTGTAGEKIFAAPYKYGDLTKNKELNIVLMALQEKENLGIFNTKSETQKSILKFYKEKVNTTFHRFTDILYQYLHTTAEEKMITNSLLNNKMTLGPILKWVGGKTQIMDTLMERFPRKIKNYYEPFIGGGSVLLSVLCNENITITGEVYAMDINFDLISMYKNVQKLPKLVLKYLEKLKEEYDSTEDKSAFYYELRDNFNGEKGTIESPGKGSCMSSAILIFLNKLCFRGLYRTGPNGFNVPYGNNKNPTIFDEEKILCISKLIQRVTFLHCDFEKCDFWSTCDKKDFIYLDPPYVPISATSFTSYASGEFQKHEQLFELCKKFKSRFLLSNSSTDLIRTFFNNAKYTIDTISCRRAIHSKDPGKKADEVLIQNY